MRENRNRNAIHSGPKVSSVVHVQDFSIKYRVQKDKTYFLLA